MKNYQITRTRSKVCCIVEVKLPSIDGELLYPLPHVDLHSKNGFECGYGGSGPADLALSILADHLNCSEELERFIRDPKPIEDAVSLTVMRISCGIGSSNLSLSANWSLAYCHDFKTQFIATAVIGVGESSSIPESDVAEWFVRRIVGHYLQRHIQTRI